MHGLWKIHRKKIWLTAGALVVVAIIGAAFVNHRLNRPFMTPEKLATIRAEVAAQKENALFAPPARPKAQATKSRDRNLYFGDLHVHSRLSFDSYIFGNRWGLADAYRFAQGEALVNPGGEKMQLTRPLDFVAITDHAEGFAFPSLCAAQAVEAPPQKDADEFCATLEKPTAGLFLALRESGEKRPMQRIAPGDKAAIIGHEENTWARIVAAADQHNRPGRFTTFAAYEYSPPLRDSGKHHRNVIFKNGTVPRHAVSGYDAAEAPDLWRALRDGCAAPCEVLTIPHNPNKSWGLAFADITIDGRAYTPADWALRDAMEPLVEMFQIKGASECAFGVGTTDEACGFEQFFPPCKDGQETLCIHPTSMARDGLKKGLLLDEQLGFNPLDFGMIGSTDTHNANPGDAEEWDYRGAAAAFSTPARHRITGGRGPRRGIIRNPGGLAAIWAPENTREALFAAMQKKEVYATSGTRIGLRFFGGFTDMQPVLEAANPVRLADRLGVPMGSHMMADMPGASDKPTFFVWAMRDPDAAALDKVQLIKSWVEEGTTKERIIDIACAEGRSRNGDGKCPDLTVALDMARCTPDSARGAGELKTVWRDDDYQAGQKAFYYVRILEVESCRWSAYDAVRAGITPAQQDRASAPQRIAERAWSSPIFVGGAGH